MIEHASTCDSCATLLATLHSEEPESIALRSATRQWQRQMVERIAPKPRRNPVWLAAAAMVAITLGSAWYFLRPSSDVGLKLVAKAYSEQRPFEMRIAGATYQASVRGAVAAGSLNETIAEINTALEKDADSLPWLRAQAQAGLMQKDPGLALDVLQKATALAPGNADVMGDSGIALMLRAELTDPAQGGRAADLVQAIDLLTQAITKQPSNAVFVFNRALAYERLPEPQLAIADWQQFLRLEPEGGWADEARRRLERQKQIAGRQAARIATDEESILPLAAKGFREAGAISASLVEKHGDTWLRDLLAKDSQSLPLLEQASKETAAGHEAIAAPLWAKAGSAMRAANNAPGQLFADLEQAYSLQRTSLPEACLRIARAALPAAQSRHYRWIEAQLYLTMAGCFAQRNDAGATYESLQAAQTRAADAGYEIQSLQALGLQAAALRQVGAYREALRRDAEGIARYWQGQGNRGRAYQFYSGMALDTTALLHTRAAGAFMQVAVSLAPNTPVEALLRGRYAELLAGNGDIESAEKEFRRVADIFKSQPDSLQLYRAYADLSRARIAVRAGEASEALEQLSRMGQLLPAIKNQTIDARYWHLQSAALEVAGRENESDTALERVLALRPTSGDPAALAREVSEAVRLLVDREVKRGHAEKALQLWTHYNPAFRSVASNTTRLTFANLPSGPVVWLSSPAGIRAARLTGANRLPVLKSSLQQFLLRAKDTDLPAIRSLGQELYRVMIAPVRNALEGATEISISADSAFASIPFGILVTDRGEWLADQYRIVYSPPLTGAEPNTPQKSGLGKVLAVHAGEAAQVMHWNLAALPDLDREVEFAAAAFPRHSILADRSATRSAVLAGLPEATAFHFSGHAVVTGNDAALVLASDGSDRLLWASRLPREALGNIRFAMLAGCSTGRMGRETDDPTATLARAFLQAGVPAVVASRWDVDSTATSVFVENFYAGLREGKALDDAFAASARRLRGMPAFAHPYYWAAFEMFRI